MLLRKEEDRLNLTGFALSFRYFLGESLNGSATKTRLSRTSIEDLDIHDSKAEIGLIVLHIHKRDLNLKLAD